MKIFTTVRKIMPIIGVLDEEHPKSQRCMTIQRIFVFASILYGATTALWFIVFDADTVDGMANAFSSFDIYAYAFMVYSVVIVREKALLQMFAHLEMAIEKRELYVERLLFLRRFNIILTNFVVQARWSPKPRFTEKSMTKWKNSRATWVFSCMPSSHHFWSFHRHFSHIIDTMYWTWANPRFQLRSPHRKPICHLLGRLSFHVKVVFIPNQFWLLTAGRTTGEHPLAISSLYWPLSFSSIATISFISTVACYFSAFVSFWFASPATSSKTL